MTVKQSDNLVWKMIDGRGKIAHARRREMHTDFDGGMEGVEWWDSIKRRWKNDIKTDLEKIECEEGHWANKNKLPAIWRTVMDIGIP